jgi:hypothetical protein
VEQAALEDKAVTGVPGVETAALVVTLKPDAVAVEEMVEPVAQAERAVWVPTESQPYLFLTVGLVLPYKISVSA